MEEEKPTAYEKLLSSMNTAAEEEEEEDEDDDAVEELDDPNEGHFIDFCVTERWRVDMKMDMDQANKI